MRKRHRGETMSAQLGIEGVPFVADKAGHLHGVLCQPVGLEWLNDFRHAVTKG
jgi:hypothetical protein